MKALHFAFFFKKKKLQDESKGHLLTARPLQPASIAFLTASGLDRGSLAGMESHSTLTECSATVEFYQSS
jgi:hypothetical protein